MDLESAINVYTLHAGTMMLKPKFVINMMYSILSCALVYSDCCVLFKLSNNCILFQYRPPEVEFQ